MKLHVKTIASLISMLIFSSTQTGYAQNSNTTGITSATPQQTAELKTKNEKMHALIAKINNQINEQENTIAELKEEVNTLKAEQQTTTQKVSLAERKSSAAIEKSKTAVTASSAAISTSSTAIKKSEATETLQNHLLDMGASPVITAPYLGVASRWDASDLIVNQPTYNEEVLLMQRDASLDKAAQKLGFATPTNPFIELSGKVEGQGYETKPFVGNTQSNLDISSAEIDFAAHVSKWVNGLVDIDYDNSAPNAMGGQVNAELISNSRVYVSQAFVTIGNLQERPIYATLGLRSMPFGHYSSYMISDTYPKLLFRIKDPAILFGYHPLIGNTGPYATTFAFKGDVGIGTAAHNVNNYGADVGYLFSKDDFNADVGISGIANVADSNGMQANGVGASDQFQGFGYAPTSNVTAEIIAHRVPGANVHLKFSKGDYTLLAEANTATTPFAAEDMSFNGHGARPAAAHMEGIYSFNIQDYPSSISIGADQTWQALALAMPQTRYIATLSSSVFKDTIESLEFKHEINYSNNDTAAGQNLYVIMPGHSSNTVTAQIGYYF